MIYSESFTLEAPASVQVTTDTAGTTGVDEVQTVTVTATGGTFTLTFDGQTTAALTFPPTAAEVKAALEALSNIDDDDLTVTEDNPSTRVYTYEVTFGGSLAETNVAQLTGSAANLVNATLIATGQTNKHTVQVLASDANTRLGGTPADGAYPIPTGAAAEGTEVHLPPGSPLYARSTSGTPTVYVLHTGLARFP